MSEYDETAQSISEPITSPKLHKSNQNWITAKIPFIDQSDLNLIKEVHVCYENLCPCFRKSLSVF